MSEPHYSRGRGTQSDAEIPALQDVLDPSEFGKHLFPVLPSEWGKVLDIQTQIVQRSHRSCTVDITLRTTKGTRELIGKVYVKDRSDVYQAMKQIRQSGFDPTAEFSIPQPLGFLTELNLLLQEKVYGETVTEIFSTGLELERAQAAERCAKWLAHFHTQAPTFAPAVDLADDAPAFGPVFDLTAERMERWLKRIGQPVGSLKDKALKLIRQLETNASALGPTEICACHGSYCHHQVIFAGNRTVAFDWDNYCVANPSIDLAKFIIELERLAFKTYGSSKALNAVVELFRETYANESGSDVAASLPLYKAAACLRLAKSHLKMKDGGLQKAEARIDEGLRILAEEL